MCDIGFQTAVLIIIGRAAESRLKKFKQFVIAHLHIAASGLRDIRGIRSVEHVVAVLSVLHAQTQSELGVAPDIIVYRSARFLCRQNQMHTQASADLRNADQFAHEVRFFPLQFRKFVDNNKHVRHRQTRLVVFI